MLDYLNKLKNEQIFQFVEYLSSILDKEDKSKIMEKYGLNSQHKIQKSLFEFSLQKWFGLK